LQSLITQKVDEFLGQIQNIEDLELQGVVEKLEGLSTVVRINSKKIHIGTRCWLYPDNHSPVLGEVISFNQNLATVMTFHHIKGLHPKCKVTFLIRGSTIYPSLQWQGRVINGLAEPIDNKGKLAFGANAYDVHGSPIPAHSRAKVKDPIELGVRAMDTFLTCCKGQRLGIFAGSGVGKSVLLSMLVKFANCDICIVGLIGERGREVREFIEDTLGEEGLKRTILVIATSDETALMRREAAYLTLRLAEFYRDLGMSVLCVIDSVTRFAMSQREIGLAAHEPPTTKGYTPSVFAELPKLLERAGPGIQREDKTGYITAFFTVLVDGDDHNEPIADAVRGILDGHVVLDRSLATRGHFPAINILQSISRTVPMCHNESEQKAVIEARKNLSIYNDMVDLIRLGAYRNGTDPAVDKAIQLHTELESFLKQKPNEFTNQQESFEKLKNITK
jgi:flagellum-specific ATP synthase